MTSHRTPGRWRPKPPVLAGLACAAAIVGGPVTVGAQDRYQDFVLQNFALISVAEENCRLPIDEGRLFGTLTAVGLQPDDVLPRGRYYAAFERHVLSANARMRSDGPAFCRLMAAEFAAVLR